MPCPHTCPPGAGAPTVFATVYSTSMYSCSSSSGCSSVAAAASRSFSITDSACSSLTRVADMRRLSRLIASIVKHSKYEPSVSFTLCVTERGESIQLYEIAKRQQRVAVTRVTYLDMEFGSKSGQDERRLQKTSGGLSGGAG